MKKIIFIFLILSSPNIVMAGVDPFLSSELAVSNLFTGAAAQLLALIALLAGIILSCCCCLKQAYISFGLALIIGVGDVIVKGLAAI